MTVGAGGEVLAGLELDELVELLRSLLRIRSVNPPGGQGSEIGLDGSARTDGEIRAARFLEQVLAAEGLQPTVAEPFAGRGSIVARVRGDGTGGDPLLLLSHLDVVPADPTGWSHDPFGGDLAEGYVWGRGAIDMKSMVAMEVQVMRRLARSARVAGRDPAADPVPGLRRDVVFCCTSDEEAGGVEGAGWVVDNHPEWIRAAAALNEAGGIAMPYAGVRFTPIQVAEKGFVVYRIHVQGRWGHGSVPTADNAAVIAAQIVARLATPGPVRLTAPVAASLAKAAPHLPPRLAEALRGAAPASPGTDVDTAAIDAALARLCDPVMARTVSAMIRDTVSVGIIRAGVKYNVIPGSAEIEIDCRILPGTDEPAMLAELRRRIGDELWARVDVECHLVGQPVEAPLDGPMYPLLEQVVRDHDPGAVPVPFLAPFATDAKHLARIGVPVYGFSPLALGDENFLTLLHADDERVSVEALRFGLPVLWDAVMLFCG
jgi:acetylornithine deacetylase/succinyl-diaminopimelate desuccinylase-like protein